MKYVGSKRRILKDILPIILRDRKPGQTFVDCFCGSGIVGQNVEPPVIACDNNPYLIGLLKAVQEGWGPPDVVTEEKYRAVKHQYESLEDWAIKLDEAPNLELLALIGFVGFACSFGAKFWGGYARGKNSKGGMRNYADEGRRNLLKRAPLLEHVQFVCADYRSVDIPPNSLLYIDPPYANTTKYRGGNFDYGAFWAWCREKSKGGHTIFISEYESPDDFRCVWQKDIVSGLDLNTGGKRGTEKLFVYDESPLQKYEEYVWNHIYSVLGVPTALQCGPTNIAI